MRKTETVQSGIEMKPIRKLGAILLALLPVEGLACFSSPEAKPLLGCMPFNFSAPLDWAGLQAIEREARENNADIGAIEVFAAQQSRFPELICYKRAAQTHLRLINRLYVQMETGLAANAFASVPATLFKREDKSSMERFDIDSVRRVKEFSPDSVVQYYPSLFAVIREFESCMLDAAKNGCEADDEGCRILGFVWMGYLPDGAQFPVVSAPPKFEPPVSEQACGKRNAFGECTAEGAFTVDEDSYTAFGSKDSAPTFVPENTEPHQASPLSADTPCHALTVECFVQDVLIGQVLNSDQSHPLINGLILLGADVFDYEIAEQDVAETILGLPSAGKPAAPSTRGNSTLLDAVEQELIDRIVAE